MFCKSKFVYNGMQILCIYIFWYFCLIIYLNLIKKIIVHLSHKISLSLIMLFYYNFLFNIPIVLTDLFCYFHITVCYFHITDLFCYFHKRYSIFLDQVPAHFFKQNYYVSMFCFFFFLNREQQDSQTLLE